MPSTKTFSILFVISSIVIAGCGGSSSNSDSESNATETDSTIDGSLTESDSVSPRIFEVISEGFEDNGMIPLVNSCFGANVSPNVSWTGHPAETAKFAIVMDDEDPPCGTGVGACRHWALLNIPATIIELPEGANRQIEENIFGGQNSEGYATGVNYKNELGYAGPCPPFLHTYRLTVYALSESMPTLMTGESITRASFELRFGAYVLDKTTISGTVHPRQVPPL